MLASLARLAFWLGVGAEACSSSYASSHVPCRMLTTWLGSSRRCITGWLPTTCSRRMEEVS